MCTLFASRWIAYVRSRIRQLLIRLLEEVIITDKYCFYIGYRLGYILTVYIYIFLCYLFLVLTGLCN